MYFLSSRKLRAEFNIQPWPLYDPKLVFSPSMSFQMVCFSFISYTHFIMSQSCLEIVMVYVF